ncbi:hypothetical protein V6N13_039390 [Hibiscus sabdariffa]
MQITLASRNPNDRVGIYYQKLDVLASYRNLPDSLPGPQGHHCLVPVFVPQCGAGGSVSQGRIEPGHECRDGANQRQSVGAIEMEGGELDFKSVSNERQLSSYQVSACSKLQCGYFS